MIVGQIIFLIVVGLALFYFYPRTSVSIDGNFVKFNSINANVVLLSENPDFSNPKYIDLNLTNNLSVNLPAGKYYYKSDNGLVEGLSHEFEIKSEVGLVMNHTENESRLVNVGNVKINITKGKGGAMVGRIILSTDESQNAEDNKDVQYTGGQAG